MLILPLMSVNSWLSDVLNLIFIMSNIVEETALENNEEIINTTAAYENAAYNSQPQTPILSEGKQKLISWIDKHFRIVMTDGRVLTGYFLCTDRDANIILGTCEEYLKSESEGEPRFLGLVMVPGRHIVSIQLKDKNTNSIKENES